MVLVELIPLFETVRERRYMREILKYGVIICSIVLIVVTIIKAGFYNTLKYKNHEVILNEIEKVRTTKEPLKEITKDDYTYMYYEDLCFVYGSSGAYIRAEIIGDKYMLDDGIKVGSEKKVVDQKYADKYKIKDLPDNEFGFIEDDVWYHFYYNELGKVEKISIYTVGP